MGDYSGASTPSGPAGGALTGTYPNPGLAALTTVSAALAADVALGNNVATNVSSVVLTAGTWLILTKCTVLAGGNQGVAYVWVGTTSASTAGAIASGGTTLPANEQAAVPIAPTVLVLTAGATYYLNALFGVAGATAKAQDLGPLGNVATQIVALKIG